MDAQLNTRRIVIFLAFAFGISWTVALAFYLTGGMQNRVIRSALAPYIMNYLYVSSPALANVATRLITRQGWGDLWLRPKFRRGWPFYLAVWLLPFLAAIVGSLAYHLVFPQSFDPDITRGRSLLAGLPVAADPNAWKVMLFLTLNLMIVQVLLTGNVLSLLEEFGWRAYLLQRLVDRFRRGNTAGVRPEDVESAAARKAAPLVGGVHGVWHWPFFFTGMGLEGGSLGVTLLALPVSVVFSCSLSILLCWATLRSGSVWHASIGHGTILGTVALAGSVLKGGADMLFGPQGLIGGLGLIVLALGLLFSRRAFAARMAMGSQGGQAAVVASRS